MVLTILAHAYID